MDEPQGGGDHSRRVSGPRTPPARGRKLTVMTVTATATMMSRDATRQVWSLEGETPITLLAELPEEVLLAVLALLDGRDLTSVTAVSSSFRRLALEDSNPQRKQMGHTWREHFIVENTPHPHRLKQIREMACQVSFVPKPQTYKKPTTILFFGEEASGRRSLIDRLLYDTFEEELIIQPGRYFPPDIKCCLVNETALIPVRFTRHGHESFPGQYNLWRGADAAVLVCDLTNEKSIQNLLLWLGEAERYFTKPRIFVVGNKSDVHSDMHIQSSAEIVALLDDWRWQHSGVFLGEYIEVSAKTGRNVDLALKYVVAALAHVNATEASSLQHTSYSDFERLHSSAGPVMQKAKKRSSCLVS
ncbi:Ras subfamily protein [Acanthamoeba castellanii str. Neff]|uniref:Ras subfamily protein n=1 Tax=Acanthamoeba castellanii (strain ATCC 30010 / Neff) TaxID=1257118 RepID=L8H8Z9_ACACF|nr:Ras subfamily protein [Acanthamoeba castellanii str. Neff]ELR21213.1 Ras subfamily protein [Acanthamoeba castellanii str. Neff]